MGVVLVTGCRSGFGLLTAVEAARRGHVVYAGLRDLDTAGELKAAAAGLPVHPLQLDVVDAAQREAAVARILDEQGRIDGLVNNAGIALGGFLEQVEEDELRRVFEVNVVGTWALTKAVLPAMRAQRSGAIVMVSSMSGRMAFPCLGTYASSKFAMEGMSEAWRHELAPFGIRVALVEPGAYATDIWGRNRTICRRARDPESPYAAWVDHVDARFDREVKKRVRPADEVAHKICDLLVDPKPALRHPMGSDAKLRTALVRYAPFALVEGILQRVMTPPHLRGQGKKPS